MKVSVWKQEYLIIASHSDVVWYEHLLEIYIFKLLRSIGMTSVCAIFLQSYIGKLRKLTKSHCMQCFNASYWYWAENHINEKFDCCTMFAEFLLKDCFIVLFVRKSIVIQIRKKLKGFEHCNNTPSSTMARLKKFEGLWILQQPPLLSSG